MQSLGGKGRRSPSAESHEEDEGYEARHEDEALSAESHEGNEGYEAGPEGRSCPSTNVF